MNAAEHIDEAVRLIDVGANQWHDEAAVEERLVTIHTAQAHALLAIALQGQGETITAEVVDFGAGRGGGDVRQGDRVLLLQRPEQSQRSFPIVGNDVLGTVVSIDPSADPQAIVDWDDIHTVGDPIPVSLLRVVLDA